MSNITGYIPEKVTFISKGYTKITNTFEDGGEINSFEAMPTFIATNEKTKETGIAWAKQQRYAYDYDEKTKQYTNRKLDSENPTVLEVGNKPFTKLRIVSYTYRSEGGGAFKMIVEDKYYVDLRIDTLLDILVNAKIEEGEVKGCKFIWARIGSQMKVVRLGSEIHKRLLKVAELKAAPIKKKDLKPGDILEQPNGNKRVFLGYVNTLEFEFTQNKGCDFYRNYEYIYSFKEIKFLKNLMVFQSHHEEPNLDNFGKKQHLYLDFLSSIPKAAKIGSVKVPDNWTEIVKSKHPIEADKLEYRDSKYYYLSEVGKFPDLLPEYEKYRSHYEKLKVEQI